MTDKEEQNIINKSVHGDFVTEACSIFTGANEMKFNVVETIILGTQTISN